MADWLLRLEGDAWLLRGPGGEQRLACEGAPEEGLPRLATSARAGDGGRLHVVLADGVLRYLVLRWPQGLAGAAERRAWLAHRFQAVHGIAEPDWVLACDRDAVGAAVLAGAAPSALIEAVRAFARQRRLRLAGVSGEFVDGFNARRRDFDEVHGEFGALARLAGGRLTVGLWRCGEWLALRSRAAGAEPAADACRMLETWRLGVAGEAGVDPAVAAAGAKLGGTAAAGAEEKAESGTTAAAGGAGTGASGAAPDASRIAPGARGAAPGAGALYADGFAPLPPAGWRQRGAEADGGRRGLSLLRNAPAEVALDFAAGRRRPAPFGWALLALGAAALGFALLGFLGARAELAEREAVVARLEGELRASQPAAGAVPVTDAVAARQVAARLQADWAGMFAGLGAAPAGEVGLLELQADAGQGRLRLRGQARSLEAAFDYVGSLPTTGALREARIERHEWVEVGAVTVLEFSASAAWGAAR